MSLRNISWGTLKFPRDSHSIFGASKYHWINYTEEKMMEVYVSSKAKKIGTELHEMAAMLIKHKKCLPDEKLTLNMYVNDAIYYGLHPEEQLYYSEHFKGTADAIGVIDDILRIHDLKTGKSPSSIHQLEIYTALFCLEQGLLPSDFKGIELRIYQYDDIQISNPGTNVIVPIMDKIVTVDKLIKKMEGEL